MSLGKQTLVGGIRNILANVTFNKHPPPQWPALSHQPVQACPWPRRIPSCWFTTVRWHRVRQTKEPTLGYRFICLLLQSLQSQTVREGARKRQKKTYFFGVGKIVCTASECFLFFLSSLVPVSLSVFSANYNTIKIKDCSAQLSVMWGGMAWWSCLLRKSVKQC